MKSTSRATCAVALALLIALAGCDEANLFTGVGAGAGQTGTIRGTVQSTAGPLGSVWIILVNQDSTITGTQGEYAFPNRPTGTYTVAVRVPLNYTLAPGDSAIRRVQLPPGGIAIVDWNLVAQQPVP